MNFFVPFVLLCAILVSLCELPVAWHTREIPALLQAMESPTYPRKYWAEIADRIARPVLTALAQGQLKATMPVEIAPSSTRTDRPDFTHLEAFGRLLCGLAPWLELGDDGTPEGQLRAELADLARAAIESGTDPNSPDFLNFARGQQPLVDTALLAQGILRAPNELWHKLKPDVQENLARALESTRDRKPASNNWLLFAGTTEIALRLMGRSWDRMRVDYAVRVHAQRHLGDGVYGDGPHFHWDYYNSFVIGPMMLDILGAFKDEPPTFANEFGLTYEVALQRSRRYAVVLERLISPEGTFPPIGRSLCYRLGALQSLGQIALLRELPDEISAAQVRCALTAVMHRMMDAPNTFDENGWLTLGFTGHQPNMAEIYVSTGSTYLCSAGLLPLGLPASDAFWSAPDAPWTAVKAWGGADLIADHSI